MMNTRRRWLTTVALTAALTAVGVATSAGPASAESNGGDRVMPLGDSITDGFRVDYVGTLFNGPSNLGDHDHEGHPGWRIDQIDASITGWLRATTPHTVLLHIGTNDVLQNSDLANAPARLS